MNFGRVRVWVYAMPVDMRKSYNGLAGLAREHHDLLSSDLFLFLSKDRKRAKAMFWDGTGLNIWMKRMERGRFADIFVRGEMSISELKLFFEGSHQVVRKLSPRNLTSEYVA